MKIFKPTPKKIFSYLLIFLLISATMVPVSASSQDLDEIKVLLKNGKFNNEHYVTLSSTYGMDILTNSQIPYVYESEPNENVSLQFDRYHLQLIETTNLNSAQEIIDLVVGIKDLKLNPNIEVIEKNSQKYYRVVVGGFDTYEAVNNLKVMLKETANIEGKILGMLYWSVGEYSKVEEANIKVQELRNYGYNGYLARVFNGTEWVNQVWIGQSSNFEEHNNLRDSIVNKLPNQNLTEINYNNPYVLEKNNGTIRYGQLTINPLIVFSQSTILNIRGKEVSPILVKERSYQGQFNKYRGELIVQIYNNDLVAINQLPLDTYLYAVVGSEVNSSWPQETLKAQTVAARTFAYSKLLSPRSSLYHILDTTDDQAYYGVSREADSIIKAVDETKGLVLLRNGKPINSFYSSNSGGMTSDGTEVWGNAIPYTSVKESTWDSELLKITNQWYRIIRANGETGYIRSDLIDMLPKTTDLGLNFGVINTEDVNFRTGPSIYRFPVITSLQKGEEIVILDSIYENNAYSWIAGPFTAEYIMENSNKYQKEGQPLFTQQILDLNVMERGPSGRVTLLADGNRPIPVKYPDYYRTLFGGLSFGVQSTLFDIEQIGRVQILGSNGRSVSVVNNKEQTYVLSSNTLTALSTLNNYQEEYLIVDKDHNFRLASKDQKYILHGNGLGHGTGMSQWGAKGMAESGYNYQDILQYYYNGIEITKIY